MADPKSPAARNPERTVSSAPSLSALGVEPLPRLSDLPRICPTCSGRYPADFRVCPRDASPLVDAPAEDDPLLGAKLGDSYQVVGVLGEGGMGKVYEARHVRLHSKRYAIKVLHGDLARQPEVVARFQREAESAAGLDHPNVVGVYDVSTAPDGRPYIVQEMLEGEDLAKRLDRIGRLPPMSAVPLVRQICRALAAAHARGIVHRDVKPENVILIGDATAPTVKVLDFGISKTAEAGPQLTKTGMIMGTPAYMAPEQARGDRVDARADVYAVGAILYRALTGRKPFEGLDSLATLSAVLVDEPPRPRSIVSSIPAELELVVQNAMAKEPSERTPSMDALDQALAPFDTASLAPSPTTTIVTGADGAARTILATNAATLLGAEPSGRAARRARPTIVLTTLVGSLGALILSADAALSALRWATDAARAPTTGQIVLSLGIALVLLVAPVVLWVRFLVRRVWSSSPRAMELADRSKVTLIAATAAFTATTLAVRIFEIVVRRTPDALAHPGWSLLSLVVTALAAVAAWFLSKLARTT